MADTSLVQRLRGLILSAVDLRQLTDWEASIIEDYLNIVDNIVQIATTVDIGADIVVQTKTSNYTTIQDDGTILADASANPVIISLDATAVNGQNHTVKCIDDTFDCFIGNNGNNIDAIEENFEIFKDESVTIRADSNNDWWII